jgi:hypothetical protein
MPPPLLRRLASALILLVSCAKGAPRRVSFPVGPAAQELGFTAYEINKATADELDVTLVGRSPARLLATITQAESIQRLQRSGEVFALRTSADRMQVEQGGRSRLLAERLGDRWFERAALDVAGRQNLGVILAADIDLAVQGTSMVFGGQRYVWCTLECVNSAACLRRGAEGLCAAGITTCAACLGQEPITLR